MEVYSLSYIWATQSNQMTMIPFTEVMAELSVYKISNIMSTLNWELPCIKAKKSISGMKYETFLRKFGLDLKKKLFPSGKVT